MDLTTIAMLVGADSALLVMLGWDLSRRAQRLKIALQMREDSRSMTPTERELIALHRARDASLWRLVVVSGLSAVAVAGIIFAYAIAP